jgi:drug/metabolite transporter (DMT)-like permease
MSQFVLGNAFLALSVALSAGSQLFFKLFFNNVGPLRMGPGLWDQISSSRALIYLGLGAVMLAAGFLFWMASLARLNLSYAYPAACGSALVAAALAAIFLGEPVTVKMWLGAALVALGTGLLVNSQI